MPTPKGATAATAAHPNTGDPAERITGGQARAGQPGQSGQGGNSQPFPFDRKLSQKKDQPTSTTKSASTPAPPNNMALRAGFGPMTASSRPMSIKVDQWAGSYDGQQRQKLQLDIDKYVERIAAALAAADRQTTAVLAEVRAGASWQAPQADRVHGARQSLDDSEKIITELVFKSQNTPYAFVGLQMKDIGTEHVRPAGVSLVRAGEDGHPSSDREADLAQAAYHIARARQRLADLVRHYEAVKREDNRNETILHATKMHQLFIEDMQQFLKSAEPTLNPRIPGSMVEVSDEFVKKLEERYKKARELMDELAKMMAQDPDLARRVSALANLKGRTLRDQLTLLTRRQQTQHETLDQWVKTQPEARGPLLEQLRQQQHDDKADLVKTADTLRYEYITWTPKKVAQAGPELSRGRLQLESIARGEHEAFSQLETGQPATSLKITQQTIAGLGTLSGILASAHGLENANGDLSIFTAKRMTEASELSSRETGWITKMRAIDQQKIHEIGAVELYRLMSDTRALGGKLTDLQPLLDELSPEVGKKAGELSAMVAETIPARQVQAGVSLKQERLFLANDQEAQALQSYQQAEAAFDELLTMVEEVQKKMPPPDPKDIPNPPSLDKLLAMLEQEMEACQKLGNAARLVNIATNFDWFMPDNNPLGGSGAMGMNGMGSGQGGVSALPPQARPQSAKMRPQDAQLAKMLAQAAQDYARQTEQAMREFVQGVQAPQQGDAPATPTQTAAQPAPEPKPQGRDWNVFASKLKNELAQGRDSDPPEAYRQAIDEYFKTIADQARP